VNIIVFSTILFCLQGLEKLISNVLNYRSRRSSFALNLAEGVDDADIARAHAYSEAWATNPYSDDMLAPLRGTPGGLDLNLFKHADGRSPFARPPYARIGEMLAVLAQPKRFDSGHQKKVHILVSGTSNIGKSTALRALTNGPLHSFIKPLNVADGDAKYLFCHGDAGTKIFYLDEADPLVVARHREFLFMLMDPGSSITIRKMGIAGVNVMVRGLILISNKTPDDFEAAMEQRVPSSGDAVPVGKYTVVCARPPGKKIFMFANLLCLKRFINLYFTGHVRSSGGSGNAWSNRVRAQHFRESMWRPFPDDDVRDDDDDVNVESCKLQAIAIAFLGYRTVKEYIEAVQANQPVHGLMETMMEEDVGVALAESARGRTYADVVRERQKAKSKDKEKGRAPAVRVENDIDAIDDDDDDDEETAEEYVEQVDGNVRIFKSFFVLLIFRFCEHLFF
jgi:hypothetical protein